MFTLEIGLHDVAINILFVGVEITDWYITARIPRIFWVLVLLSMPGRAIVSLLGVLVLGINGYNISLILHQIFISIKVKHSAN